MKSKATLAALLENSITQRLMESAAGESSHH
jgi:hypothetical protein